MTHGPERSVVLAGAGQMGGALLSAWLESGMPPASFVVLEPHPSDELAGRLASSDVALNPATTELRSPSILVLAIKPQALEAAAPTLAPLAGPETVLVSVVAGKTTSDLRRAFPQVGLIVRAMPNTPAAIRQGVTGVAVEPHGAPVQRDAVQALLEAVGQVEWLADESQIDAVTAVSGSGPAYVFHLTECLARAGEAAGLDPGVAARLARATIQGAAALMAARPETAPETLRRNVTSPGGTTAAAVAVLQGQQGLAHLMEAAVLAAKRRAGELAG